MQESLFTPIQMTPNGFWKKMQARAALCLVNAACQQGLCLYGISGYRSYQRQAELYTGSPYVAGPGTSEHQSGLALDLSVLRFICS